MLLSLSKLKKSFGERVLFDDVSFSVGENDKIGLVGANGCGKTTLFKIILGQETYSGELHKNKSLSIGYLQQQTGANSDLSVLGEVMTVFKRLSDIEHELSKIDGELSESGVTGINSLISRQHDLREEYQRSGGYTYKSRARAALLGLGFTEPELSAKLKNLSGGQKTRVFLCKVLLSESTLLMLDEPTNHLDLESVAWLEGFLKNYCGAAIIISHDRYFLDRITDKTLEISAQTLGVYEGNYTKHLLIKEEREKVITRQYENTNKEIERLEAVITEQRRWNKEKSVKRAESKQKAVDKLKESLVAPTQKEHTIKFSYKTQALGGTDVLMCDNISMSFGEKELLKGVDIHITRGEKVFLTGANGCGKTTLFKIIYGTLSPKTGTVRIGAGVKVGYYDQAQDDLCSYKTAFEEVSDAYPDFTQTQIRNALASFLFTGDDAFKVIGNLSGGERARILLLKLMLSGANFLLLDEPTNHLDIASREMLEKALSEYDGTILAVSHDRYFMNKLSSRILHLSDKSVKSYHGNYDYFCEKRDVNECIKENTPALKPEEKSGAADYRLKKEWERKKRQLLLVAENCEKEILELEAQKSELVELLLLPENVADYIKLSSISAEIESIGKHLLKLYDNWSEADEELSRMQ